MKLEYADSILSVMAELKQHNDTLLAERDDYRNALTTIQNTILADLKKEGVPINNTNLIVLYQNLIAKLRADKQSVVEEPK